MQSLLLNNCDLFSRIFEVFNEMEMKIKVINNKNFTKFYVEIKEKEFHNISFSKPHERVDLFITASMNIYQTKKEKKVFQ